MNDKPAAPEAEELLRMIGQVPLPDQGVFDHAREVLWSAIGREAPGTLPLAEQAGEAGAPAGTEEAARRRRAQRRQTGQADSGRRMSLGGGAPPESR